MNCSQCKLRSRKLIEIFGNLCSGEDSDLGKDDAVITCLKVCEQCVVGNDVPVYRPILNKWHIGEVENFDEYTSKHSIRFLDESTEWVTIDPSPSASYIAFDQHQSNLLQKRNLSELCKFDPFSSADDFQFPKTRLPPRSPMEKKVGRETIFRRVPLNPNVYQYPAYGPTNPWVAPTNQHTPFAHQKVVQSIAHYPAPYCGPTPEGRSQLTRYAPHMGYNSTAPPYYNPPSSRNTSRLDGESRKIWSRPWTLEEDGFLIRMIESSSFPIKWSNVSQLISERTGKQCRERYLNHLKPKLKVNEWSPKEDSLIFYLHGSCGSKWATMSKVLKGRSDNRIKNRFHHLCRRLERDLVQFWKYQRSDELDKNIRTKRIRVGSPREEENYSEILIKKIRKILPDLAAASMSNETAPKYGYTFGPFRIANSKGESCTRCQLVAPSTQTGHTVCTATGWCQACTRVPPYVSKNMLRECLSLRCA